VTEPPRVALVAGAARGIGAATVTALAAGGGGGSWPSTGAPMTRRDPGTAHARRTSVLPDGFVPTLRRTLLRHACG